MTRLQLNRIGTEVLSDSILEAAQTIARENGLTVRLGRGTFDRSGGFATVKLEFAAISDDGTPTTPEADAFRRFAVMFDLQPEWLGETFSLWDGKTYRIVGLNTRAPKMPVICEREGKRYKFPALSVASHMTHLSKKFAADAVRNASPGIG